MGWNVARDQVFECFSELARTCSLFGVKEDKICQYSQVVIGVTEWMDKFPSMDNVSI